MKKVALSVAICGLALLLTAGAALGQSGPGQAAALCEGLQDATPGLYGLCLAFHNVEPCVPDPLAPDPFAGCEAKDGRLLARYNALKDPDDPRMPGTDGPCPCFARTKLEDEAALQSEFDFCAIDTLYPFYPSENWPGEMLLTSIRHEAWGAEAQLTTVNSEKGPRWPGICRYQALGADLETLDKLTYAEVTACRDIIADVIRSREDDCFFLCDPECPEE